MQYNLTLGIDQQRALTALVILICPMWPISIACDWYTNFTTTKINPPSQHLLTFYSTKDIKPKAELVPLTVTVLENRQSTGYHLIRRFFQLLLWPSSDFAVNCFKSSFRLPSCVEKHTFEDILLLEPPHKIRCGKILFPLHFTFFRSYFRILQSLQNFGQECCHPTFAT